MKSVNRRMRSILNKKGQVIELVGGTIMGILGLILIVFAVLYAVAILNPAGLIPVGSAQNNASITAIQTFQTNLTGGVQAFGQYLPTVFTILGVVFVLGGVLLLVLYIKKMQSGASGSGGVSL